MSKGKRLLLIFLGCLWAATFANYAYTETVGFTDTNHLYKGNSQAPITLVEYSDYLCPFCARHNRTTAPELIEKYVKSGKLKLEFRHFPIASLHPTAARGHEAAACTAQQSAELFWQYHSELFTRQKEWNRLADPSDFLTELAKSLDLEMSVWDQCYNDGLQKATIETDIEAGKSLEFNGTPTFQLITSAKPDRPHTISGARSAEHFSEAIDALLAGEDPPAPPEKPKPELPAWAKPDALAPDPDRPGFTVSGDPYHGDDRARLVIVEFTDYQCPACAKHALETQPAIEEQLIDTGKVRWVNKHLPLPEHKNAMIAAAAVECAANVGKVKEIQQALFENQDEWALLESPESAFVEFATNSNIDIAKFSKCLGSRQALEGVLADVYVATTITRATPLFVVLDEDSLRLVRGATTSEKFIGYISEQLANIAGSTIAN